MYLQDLKKREYNTPPSTPPRRTKGAEGTCSASCGRMVPGQAPVRAMPMPSRRPPMMLASYFPSIPKLEGWSGEG